MSDNQPSGNLGGLLAGLFGSRTNDDNTQVDGGIRSHHVLGGALLAAGAAYLYKRYKNGNLNVPGLGNNSTTNG